MLSVRFLPCAVPVRLPVAARLQDALRGQIQAFRRALPGELAPAHRGETFTVPRLMAHVQGELAFGDTDVFMEGHA